MRLKINFNFNCSRIINKTHRKNAHKKPRYYDFIKMNENKKKMIKKPTNMRKRNHSRSRPKRNKGKERENNLL